MKNLEVIRHSTAHLMAAAINNLYKNTKFGIGPAIEDGFYYDVDQEIQENDLKKIEEEMYSLTKKILNLKKKKLIIRTQKKFLKNNHIN